MHQKHKLRNSKNELQNASKAQIAKNELQSASKTQIAKQQNDLQNCKVHQKHKLRKQ